MDKQIENNVLIIGGPNAGKTHFGGQLYGRLNSGLFNYKIATHNRPADLTIFQDVLDKLSEGKRASHTEASANRSIKLVVNDKNNDEITFAFPDYAGEQVRSIVDNRQVNKTWKDYIEQSNSWMLFIRLDEVKQIEDIINRGIPSLEEIEKRKKEKPPVKLTDAANFVELLQMILHIKGISSSSKIQEPNLTVLLSCWDILDLPEKTIPSEILKERLPLFYYFIKNNWLDFSLSIIGLSSTEKTLTDEPDDDYIERTPIDFGYIITSEGEKQKDLTLSINTFIGKK